MAKREHDILLVAAIRKAVGNARQATIVRILIEVFTFCGIAAHQHPDGYINGSTFFQRVGQFYCKYGLDKVHPAIIHEWLAVTVDAQRTAVINAEIAPADETGLGAVVDAFYQAAQVNRRWDVDLENEEFMEGHRIHPDVAIIADHEEAKAGEDGTISWRIPDDSDEAVNNSELEKIYREAAGTAAIDVDEEAPIIISDDDEIIIIED